MAMDGRCKTCRHWSSDVEQDRSMWGVCDLTRTANTQLDDDAEYNRASKALAQDAEGWSAWLATAPDFGCVQWEAREDGE